jgi:GT2 family glycosyltransferase
MKSTAPVAVIIPTYNRGFAVISVLEKVHECDPTASEILVHIDSTDGMLEGELRQRFPNVKVLTSTIRLGPGGGRHLCLLACSVPYAVSFDDDSYPVDSDFFWRVERLFSEHSRAAILGASIWHRHEAEKPRIESMILTPSYRGCGYAVRLAAYRQVRGTLPRPVPYGMEETDLSMQFLDSGWHIYEAGELRVFHDTDLKHHESPEITSGVITNVGLCAFLNYPIVGWGLGFLQVASIVVYSMRMGRIRGICRGLFRIPLDCYRNRQYRKPIAWRSLKRFLRSRRAEARKVDVGSGILS